MTDSLTPGQVPERVTLEGRYATLVPFDAALHAESLWEAVRGTQNDALWDYLFEGPFADFASFQEDCERKSASRDPLVFAIVDKASGRTVGRASLMRIEPKHRCIEVGSILYSSELQRTRGATEAMYLMARYVFEDLRYRRYEWKCNALNEPSRRAALRLGFSFEGIFRQHMIAKGRNRDTAWFSMIDLEWPARKVEFERWLASENFDTASIQRSRLA